MQEHKHKAFEQLTAVHEAHKMESDHIAREAAEVDEYQVKNKEKDAGKQAAIESAAEQSHSSSCHTCLCF